MSELKDWNKNGFVLKDGELVRASSQVAKGKVKKLPYLNIKQVHAFSAPEEPFKGRNHFPPHVAGGGNKKIIGAKKSVNEAGVKFDSSLERYMYDRLTATNIDFEFQVEYLLQDKFRYHGKAIRAITVTVDFVVDSRDYNSIQTIIDTKGFQTQQGAIRWKLLKKWLLDNWRTSDPKRVLPTIEHPSTKTECDLLINRLLYDKK